MIAARSRWITIEIPLVREGIMRPIHRHLTSFTPKPLDSGRTLIPCANVVLLLAFTPFLSCPPTALAQAIQAPEQCNYTTDQDLRPAAPTASAEAAATA